MEIFNLLVFIEVLIVQWWRHTETVYIVKLFSGQAVQKLFVTSIVYIFFPRRKKNEDKDNTNLFSSARQSNHVYWTDVME